LNKRRSDVPESPEPAPNEVPPASLLVECLRRYEDGGPEGLCSVLRGHPAAAPALLRRVLLLADLGLLPDPPAELRAG
jgi:hypothetical protein